MTAILLARIQFAMTIGFHFLFPPLSIGLAWYLVFIELAAWKSGDEGLKRLGQFFGKIFALTFAAGAATGIVMALQFGTNWGEFVKRVNAIFGSIMAIEVFFAFFIESTFLGIYLFARDRVPRWFHWVSILMVALGATFSAFWILSANSWMQSPAGYTVVNGQLVLKSLFAAVFNPSFGARFLHTMVAALETGAFAVTGFCALLVLKGRADEPLIRLFRASVIVAFVIAILQIIPSGHQQAVHTEAVQPAKFASLEGLYETQGHAPFTVFGIPTDKPPYLKAHIKIPGFLSYMFDFKGDKVVQGLKDFPPDQRPPFKTVFISFHLMVLCGILMLLVSGLAVILLLFRKLFTARWLLWTLAVFIPVPLIANQLGWITTEVGRQPWIIYQVLKTKDAVTVTVTSGQLITSLALIGITYVLLLGTFIALLTRLVNQGPGAER
jgi:cytochrome bd ubiquinol oxidase subunit I